MAVGQGASAPPLASEIWKFSENQKFIGNLLGVSRSTHSNFIDKLWNRIIPSVILTGWFLLFRRVIEKYVIQLLRTISACFNSLFFVLCYCRAFSEKGSKEITYNRTITR